MHIFSYITLKKITFDLCEFSRQSDLFQQDLLFIHRHTNHLVRDELCTMYTPPKTRRPLYNVYLMICSSSSSSGSSCTMYSSANIYIYPQPASAAAGLVASNKTRGRRLRPQLQQWPQPRVEVSVVALLLDKTTKRGEGILDSFFFFFHQEGSPCMYVSSVTLPCSSF